MVSYLIFGWMKILFQFETLSANNDISNSCLSMGGTVKIYIIFFFNKIVF